ncbi:MAG: HemK2/MTQ2 family protein methyltransferase [Candidatus Nanohaloarchaea archaeon]
MIYVPREDSYVLNDYIKKLELHQKDFLEIGVGSGLIIESAREKGAQVTASDINEEALNQLDSGIKTFKSDLFQNIEGRYDLIVFNPPYLPGEKKETEIDGSETWYGGKKGIEVSERFLDKCKRGRRGPNNS